MFEKMFKRPYYVKRHINAPLLEERLKYIQYWTDLGRSKQTLMTIAQYLLRIVEFLPLETNNFITIKQVEEAADYWAKYQSNHPQKRSSFSRCGKERFAWYAINWLKKINRLESLPAENIPVLNKIFKRRIALQRHANAPLLKERITYLQYWVDNGAVNNSLRRVSQYLLVVMEYLNFYQLRTVSITEIEKAAAYWAKNKKNCKRKNSYSKIARARFISNALGWLNMLGCLEKLVKQIPFEGLLTQYVAYMRVEQGLSENTIKSRTSQLRDFLVEINKRYKAFNEITLFLIDEILSKKYKIDRYSRRGIQSYASVIRSFLRYAETQSWCQKNLADSIKTPRVYRHESLPYSPSWEDVKEVLARSKTDQQTDIRDYAILMLLAVYGLRCSEIKHLCLENLDWKNELLRLRRAKSLKPQTFPLSKPVGNAILDYLKQVRPNNCELREVFICRKAPYRPLSNPGIYQIVSRKLKPIAPYIKHYGPHALRHACATYLINEGLSLKEISDHLGHQGLETTRIYAKVDLTNLRKIAEFELGDLL